MNIASKKSSELPPLIILNPAAGSGRAGNFEEQLKELAGKPVVKLTAAPGEGKKIAQEACAQGYKTIIVAGGDGLINEVANGFIAFHKPTFFWEDHCLGILPLGTMNVFATELKLPIDSLEEAWSIILERHLQYIDLPQVQLLAQGEECSFVQLAGVGLDAQVLKETSREAKLFLGPISYLMSFLRIIIKKPPAIFLYCEDNKKEKKRGSALLLGNGQFYGGPFPFFAGASLQDGLLHGLLFKHQYFWELLGNIPSLLLGKTKHLSTVSYFKTKKITIEAEDPTLKIPFELDGEMVSYLPIEVTLSTHQLPVIVPKITNKKNER